MITSSVGYLHLFLGVLALLTHLSGSGPTVITAALVLGEVSRRRLPNYGRATPTRKNIAPLFITASALRFAGGDRRA